MGNFQERIAPAKTDIKRQVDSDHLKQRPIYQLIDMKKGGQLIDIMRRAISEHKFTNVMLMQATYQIITLFRYLDYQIFLTLSLPPLAIILISIN